MAGDDEDFRKKLYDEESWGALSPQEKVEAIIEAYDERRLMHEGGYPSEWTFLAGRVIWASIDHRGAPDLVILPMAKFVERHEDIITDTFED